MFMTDWLSSANESSQAKRKRLRLNLLLMILLTYAGTAFGISTMRCGHNLIELQDDKYTVLEI